MEPGDWKFFQAAAAFRRAIATGFVHGFKGTFNVGSAKGLFPKTSFFCPLVCCPLEWSAYSDRDVLALQFLLAKSLSAFVWETMVDVSADLEGTHSVPDFVDCDDGSIALAGISSDLGTADHDDSSIALVGFPLH